MDVRIRNMKPGDATSWRQAFGEVLRVEREVRGKSVQQVARRARVSASDVESWERGATVPNSEQWKALCQGVNRSLTGYGEQWRHAKAEADQEREAITRSIEVHNGATKNNPTEPVTTKLGDKLAGVGINAPVKPGSLLPPIVSARVNVSNSAETHAAIAAGNEPGVLARIMAKPEPTPEKQRKPMPSWPPGAKSASAIEQRKKFVRELVQSRPNIRTSGADSVIEAVRHRFNIGISPEFVDEIRDSMRSGASGRSLHEQAAEPPGRRLQPTAEALAAAHERLAKRAEATTYDSAIAAQPVTVVGLEVPTSEGDITAAVKLIRDAIPELQTFTIDIDEEGNASVDYQVREVRVTTRTASIKVPK